MKRRGSRGEAPPETGPFRKPDFPNQSENLPHNEGMAIKRMREKIAAEGKFSIQLPENVKAEDAIPLFEDALKNNIDPKDIVFYSIATGILKFTHSEEAGSSKTKSFYYNNPNNKDVELDIFMNMTKKEPPYITIYSLSTKAKVENDRKQNKEEQKRGFNQLILRCESDVQDVTQIVKTIEDPSEEGKEFYIDRLKTLKTNAEYLVSAINEKLDKATGKKK